MRPSLLSLMAVLLVLSCGTLVSAQSSASNTFTTNLSLGARGTQVVALQKILNRDFDTRIASTGPGSPGYETDYFGLLTKAAVVRFQEKYASEVLAPAGLTQGSGYVGLYTRTKLNTLSVMATNTVGTGSSIAKPAVTSSTSTTASQNSNLQNLSALMTAIDKVAVKQGLSITEVAAIKEQVMKTLATTTDLRAAFLRTIPQNKSNQTAQNTSFIGRTLATIEHVFNTIFMPEHVRAATPTVPFGGALLEALPCNGGVWLLTLEPLPPSFVVLLSYLSGEQAFLSYNIPLTNWLLGEYAPGAGICFIGHVYIPSEGVITPMVGSSPL